MPACQYTIFGIRAALPAPLPWPATPADRAADVEVRLDKVADRGEPVWSATDERLPFACERLADDGFLLIWPGIRIKVSATLVVVDARCWESAVPLLLQPAWSVLLALRNVVSLHGSAVDRNGAAWAFLGRSGSGKSTIAHGLIERGWTLVADDLIAIDDHLEVAPGPPFLRLANGDRTATMWVNPEEKQRLAVPAITAPTRLHGIVVFGEQGAGPPRLRGGAAISALLDQRYIPFPLGAGSYPLLLNTAGRIASTVPIVRIPTRTLSPDSFLTVIEGTR